jgi:molybdate transport system substrate-binding protein
MRFQTGVTARHWLTAAALSLLAPIAMAPAALARDVMVLTAGAYKPVLLEQAKGFEAATGDHLIISNDTGGALAARIAGGEAADLVILPKANLEALAAAHRVPADGVAPVATTGIGIAVKHGAPKPAIDTVETFRAALLAAPSIALIDPSSGGSSGIYLTKLFNQLGIADVLKAKSVLVKGGLAATPVAKGEAAMALQQMSELRLVPGVDVVGPLPAPIQNVTIYAAAVPSAAKAPDAGKALSAWLRAPAVMNTLAAHGLDTP